MFWGKLIGALIGFKLGGPLGLLVGLVIGHWIDVRFGPKKKPSGDFFASVFGGTRAAEALRQAQLRQETFTTSVVNLAAKLCKADGQVVRAEIDAFKAIFAIHPSQMAVIGRMFDEARAAADGYEPYAERLRDAFHDTPIVLAEVLEALHRIALADGRLHEAERAFLERVRAIFGLDGQRHFAEDSSQGDDPYAVLGVSRAATTAEIKARWRELTREHHPDRLSAKGMPQEYIDLATRKMAEINAAWDRIRAERGEP